MNRRVVVTGLGTVNPLAGNVPEFWSQATRGVSAVRTVKEFAIPDDMSQMAGIIDHPWSHGEALLTDLDAPDGIDRGVRLAIAATEEAMRHAGLTSDHLYDLRPSRAGVSLSTAIAGITQMEAQFRNDTREGSMRLRPATRTDPSRRGSFQFGTLSAVVAQAAGIVGEHVSVVTGCTGGLDAIAHAVMNIRAGKTDLMITGASEAPITPLVVAAFSRINATSRRNDTPETASRPWSRGRDGFVLAEGAGILILEELQHARRRGVHILAEITGIGSVSNAFHMTSMPSDGQPIARSVTLALADAGLHPGDVDSINAHGSSTPMNDQAESNALEAVLGGRIHKVPCTSMKSQLGHALSAANAIETIASVLTISTQVVPPTINHDDPDPDCRVNVPTTATTVPGHRHVLKTSSGFSGIHTAMVLSPPRSDR